MKPIDLDGFEKLFRASGDPWNYRSSRFEAIKRRHLIQACGSRKAGRALEVACANGETSRALLPHCLTLTAVDGAPTALAEARRLTNPNLRIQYRYAVLPQDTPRGPFDLIVVSEIAYYLSTRALNQLIKALEHALAPGGRIVILHHLVPFDDAARLPELAHGKMRQAFSRSMIKVFMKRCSRYEVVAFVRRK
ncbi:methyltransferase domain-containing protein [Aureimonas fodinaquatilis]|uniref:Methyltransferase domain-containing protein n=1 Tax=Aureimonas fodinaquatilis TaxID=2565783 RepID=A0A5B0DYV3_9HYPH|nr:SAM-dependent methyltransferase [Aureimonas fodinaquatilis]KAA0970720.1 methyltransferase domain-containing protein [Aureimonas fodinaquatilis]